MNFLIYPHDTQECKLQMESRKLNIYFNIYKNGFNLIIDLK
jgi:hypothetical protein